MRYVADFLGFIVNEICVLMVFGVGRGFEFWHVIGTL